MSAASLALASLLQERADDCNHVRLGAPRCDRVLHNPSDWCNACLMRTAADVIRTLGAGVTIEAIGAGASTELRSIIRAAIREANAGVAESDAKIPTGGRAA